MGILGRNFLHTAVSNFVLKFGIGLVIAVVTARALEPEGSGEYFLLVTIITTITTLFNFGIPGTNTYFKAQKKFSSAQLTRASIVLTVPITIVSVLVLYILYVLRLDFIFPTSKLTITIVASLGIVPIVFYTQFAQGIIVGENRISLNNYISLSSQGVLAVALTILYFLGSLTVPVAIALYASSFLLALAIIIGLSSPPLAEVLKSRMQWSEYGELLRFSGAIHIGNLAQFFNYRLDAFIVSFFLGTAAVGLYSRSKMFSETVWLLSTSMAAVLLPTLAGQHEKSKEIAVKAAVATLGVSVVAGTAAFLIGPTLIVFLLRKAFEGSVEPFLILLPGIVIFSITNVLATYVTAVGKPGHNAAIAFISFLFTVIFDILFIPRYGISGAALASGISYTVSSILTVIVFWRVSRMSLPECVAILKSMSTDFRSIVTRMKQRVGMDDRQSGSSGTP